MNSLSDQRPTSEQRPTSGAAAIFSLLLALPLMALVAIVFVRSISIRDDHTARIEALGGLETVVDAEPAPLAAADESISSVETAGQIAEQAPAADEAKKPEPAPAAAKTIEPAQATKGSPASVGGGEQPSRVASAAPQSASQGILVEELSKETYNALTELRAMLDSEAWDDAAKFIASLDSSATSGVAQYFRDHALLTSLPVAVQLARDEHPQLRQILMENTAALAKLRVTQAKSAGNGAMLELAAIQFAGTPAAAEAQRWLGDRALMRGQFDKAIVEYERARRGLDSANDEIEQRIRLAAAMLGREAGAPASQAIQFGDVTMSPAQFEALVSEMRDRHRGSLLAGSRLVGSRSSPANVPAPGRFESHVRSRLDGPAGERPQDDLGRGINKLQIPWADRQIGTAEQGEVLYVSNRFQVAAYNLASGERMWQSQTPPGPMQRAQEWGLIAMRPLIAGERVYARLLYSPSPLLVCLDKSSGKLIWVGESRENEFLVSDPVVVDGQLVALGVFIQPDQRGILRYHQFDPHTGEIVRTRELVRLRSTWGARACCEMAECEDGIVVVLGGAVLAVDGAANVGWIRTQIATTPDDDRRWVEQIFQRPIINNGRLYVAQPGVRSVDCLDAATGRSYWSAGLPELVGMLGLAGNLLVVQTTDGVYGLDAAKGTTRWQSAIDNLFSFHLVDNSNLLVASRERSATNSDRWLPRLTWVNLADGKPVATTMLSELADSDPRLGPLVPYRNCLFTFFGRGQQDATRDLVELIPKGEPERAE